MRATVWLFFLICVVALASVAASICVKALRGRGACVHLLDAREARGQEDTGQDGFPAECFWPLDWDVLSPFAPLTLA